MLDLVDSGSTIPGAKSGVDIIAEATECKDEQAGRTEPAVTGHAIDAECGDVNRLG